MIADQSNVQNLERRLWTPDADIVIMDGGVGTEFRDRAADYGIKLIRGLWSATALITDFNQDILYGVHRDFIPYSDLIIANTFRTQKETFDAAGLRSGSKEATRDAVIIARQARDDAEAFDVVVAFSAASLNDCYNPIPGKFTAKELEYGHYRHAKHAVEAGAEIMVGETFPNIEEARAALLAAKKLGVKAIISFYTTGDGTELPSGESLEEAAFVAEALGAIAVGTNCVSPRKATKGIELLADLEHLTLPLVTYPQGHEPREFELDRDIPIEQYAEHVHNELVGLVETNERLRVVGGCCNVTPLHNERLAKTIKQDSRRLIPERLAA